MMLRPTLVLAMAALALSGCTGNDDDTSKTDSDVTPGETDAIDGNRAPEVVDATIIVEEDASVDTTLVASDADGDPLSYTVQQAPENGTLSLSGNVATYTPTADFVGADAYAVSVSDGVDAVTLQADVTVTPVNDPPVPNGRAFTTDEDVPVEVDLTAFDADGDDLTYTLVALPTIGTLTGVAPNLTFVPFANQSGTDALGVEISDGTVTITSVVELHVLPLEDVPVAPDIAITTVEDAPVNIVLGGTDGDGDPLTWTVDTPAEGTLTGTAPNVRWTPPRDANGVFTFTYRVNDTKADSADGTVTITVTPAQDAPVAVSGAREGTEDQPVDLAPSCSDPDGDALTVNIVSTPAQGGTVNVVGGAYIWTPPPDLFGVVSFTYTCNDGTYNSNLATLTVTLAPVPDPPIASSFNVDTNEDVPAPVLLRGSDPDGDPLTYAVVTPPSHGTLTGTPPNLTYNPESEYDGLDMFTYTVSDGTFTSSPAVVGLNIRFVPDAPVATPGSVSTQEDTPVDLTLTGTDLDNDPLTFEVVQSPTMGTLTGTPPNLTYTPNPNVFGDDVFTFRADDGGNSSGPARFDVSIAPVNDAPTASPASASTTEDTQVCATLPVDDVDGDALTVVIDAPDTFVVMVTGTEACITPPTDASGTFDLSYTVSDPDGAQATSGFTLEVAPAQDAPVAADIDVSTAEDTPITFDLPASDVDGDILTCTVGPLQFGSATVSGCTVTYTPNPDVHGVESTTWAANDGVVPTPVEASLGITITPTQDAPVLDDATFAVNEDDVLTATLAPTDVDGDTLTLSVFSQPAHGTAVFNGFDLVYTPEANYHGDDALIVSVTDGQNDTQATITLDVLPINDAPVVGNLTLSGFEDAALEGSLLATDIDGDTLTYTLTAAPSHATVTPGPFPDFTLTPTPDWSGVTSFTVEVTDGTDTVVAQVDATFAPVADTPTVQDFVFDLDEDTSDTFVVPAADVDGDALDATFSGTAATWIAGSGLNFTVTPPADVHGTFSVPVTVTDPSGRSANATLTLTVRPVNDAPVLNDRTVTTPEDQVWSGQLAATDVDNDPLTYALTTPPARGTAAVQPDGHVTYTPASNDTGPVTFGVTVTDSPSGATDAATITVLVGSTNDAPVAACAPVHVQEDGTTAVVVTATDADNDPLTASIILAPSFGTAVATSSTAPFSFDYTPEADQHGTDTFDVMVSDGELDDIVTCSITVAPVQDRPVASDIAFTVDEDDSFDGTATAFDADGDPLTWSVLVPPERGVLSGTLPAFTYTPNADASGSDSFALSVTDGFTAPVTVQATVTITPKPDAPVLTCAPLAIDEDTSGTLSFVVSDADGNTPAVSVDVQPTLGTLVTDGPTSFTFTANPDAHGNDSATLRAADADTTDTIVVCPITVRAVNDAPVLANITDTLAEDTTWTRTLQGVDIDTPQGSLVYTLLSQPSQGSATLVGKQLTFTPAPNSHGLFTFTVQISDGSLTDTATVSLTVTPTNDDPVLTCTLTTLTEDDGATDLNMSVSDPDGDDLTLIINGLPGLTGSASVNGLSVSFTPAPDFAGSGRVSIRVDDGSVQPTFDCLVDVTAVNDDPVFSDAAFSTQEDTDWNGTLAARVTDVDGGPPNFTLLTAPANGSVSVSPAGAATYSPNPNFTGTDSFTVTVTDGAGGSTTGSVSMDVTPVPDAPKITAPSDVTVDEDSTVTVSLTVVDPDGADTFTIDQISVPIGVVAAASSGASPTFTYTPPPNGNAPTQVDVTVRDSGGLVSAIHSISVTVNPSPDAPTASCDDVVIAEDSAPFNVTVRADDVDPGQNASLTITNTSVTSHGSVTAGSRGLFTYTPNANATGVDTLTFVVEDVTGRTATATCTVTITAANDAPVFAAQSVVLDEDTVWNGDLAPWVTDPDGGAPQFTLTGQATHGIVNLAGNGVVSYTPQPNYNGSDSFDVSVADGNGGQTNGTVLITVHGINDPPVLSPLSFRTDEDVTLVDTILVTDVDDTSFTVSAPVGSTPGLLIVGEDTQGVFLSFEPNPNYTGTFSFSLTVTDASGGATTETITITVDPVNDAPRVLSPLTASVDEDDSVDISYVASDPDNGDSVSLLSAVAQHGTAVISPSTPLTVTYTPNANYFGPDTIDVVAQDDAGAQSPTFRTDVTVRPVNDAPTFAPQTIVVDEDATWTGSLAPWVSDIDGGAPQFTLSGQPSHGTVSLGAAGGASYTPDADYAGTDSFDVSVSDGAGGTATGTVQITVSPINDAPVFTTLAFSGNEDASCSGSLAVQVFDADGDTPQFSVRTEPGHGTLSLAPSGAFTYAPTSNYHGADSFRVDVSDGQGGTDVGTITITVLPVNDPPTITGRLTANEDTNRSFDPRNFLDDIDGDTLSVVSVTATAANGTVTGPFLNSYTYRAPSNASGTFTLSVEVQDAGGTFTLPLPVDVAPVNDLPVFTSTAMSASVDEFTPADFTPSATDIEDAPSQLTYAVVTQPSQGTVAYNGTRFRYTPAAGMSGRASFVVQVTDTEGGQAAVPLTIQVDVSRVGPTTTADTYTLPGNYVLTVASPGVLANDADLGGGPLNVTTGTFTTTLGGSITMASGGGFTYSPPTGFGPGTDTVTYTVHEEHGASATATITFAIGNVVWFVDANAATGGTGTSARPFRDIPQAASVAFGNETIAVKHRSTDYSCAAIAQGVTLIGDQVNVTRSGRVVLPASGVRPRMRGTSTPCLTLSSDSRVQRMSVRSDAGTAIAAFNADNVSIAYVTVYGADDGILINDGTSPVIDATTVLQATNQAIEFNRCSDGSLSNISTFDAVDATVLNDANGTWTFKEFDATNMSSSGIVVENASFTGRLVLHVEQADIALAPFAKGAGVWASVSGSVGAPGTITVLDTTISAPGGRGVFVTAVGVGASDPLLVTTSKVMVTAQMEAIRGSVSNGYLTWDSTDDILAANLAVSLFEGHSGGIVRSRLTNADQSGNGVGFDARVQDHTVFIGELYRGVINVTEGPALRVETYDDLAQADITALGTPMSGDVWLSMARSGDRLFSRFEAVDIDGSWILTGPVQSGFLGLASTTVTSGTALNNVAAAASLSADGNRSYGLAPLVSVTNTVRAVAPGDVRVP